MQICDILTECLHIKTIDLWFAFSHIVWFQPPPRQTCPQGLLAFNMAVAGEKTLAHSRNHVTNLSTESGSLFKMAAKIKSERIRVRGLETGEKKKKGRQRQTQKKLKI